MPDTIISEVATVFCLHSLADIGIRSERATSNSQRTM